ncbi:MAG: heme lyase CcmF/NrfE family subunit [Rhodospirillales bacterium]
MTAEAGHFALALALGAACAQAALGLCGGGRSGVLTAAVKAGAVTQAVLILVSFAALTHLFVTSDFSAAIVTANSHTAKPWIYKVSGVWGNHEGSMLLWVLILSVFGAAVALFGRSLPPGLQARVLGVQGLIGVGFLAFILFTSNPFERLHPPPFNGRDLNPLLQDIGLALHPPMLYLGYVGFSVAFSFAVAALMEGRVDAAWARWVRPWTLAAWGFLTGGIGLGSWWAYYELGWGGWWFWDPVENASFMPWLAGTALLHSSIIVEKRDALKGWTVFLAIITFGFSLLGTFLVRSGVLTSVHAFAVDPERGVFILGLLLAALGGSLALFAWRGPMLHSGGAFRPVSREGALLLNNLILSTAAGAVLLGTLYPLFMDALGAGKISVGPPFFNAVFIPMMVPLIAAMAVGPMLSWKRADLAEALRRLTPAFAALVLGFAMTAWVMGEHGPVGLLGAGLAVWLGAGTLTELAGRIKLFRARPGESWRRFRALPRGAMSMTLAHLGLAVAIVGMTGASVWKIEHLQVMAPGDTAAAAGFDFRFENIEPIQGPNYLALRGKFTVTRNGEPAAVLAPERRWYVVGGQRTAEAGIATRAWGDLYAVIGEADTGAGVYPVRIYINPFAVWMWAGIAMMCAGAAAGVFGRRGGVGAPRRSRTKTEPDTEQGHV